MHKIHSRPLRLYAGKKSTGIAVRRDPDHPTMFRVHMPSGEVSDMANLAWAKDAAAQVAHPTRGEVVTWRPPQRRSGAPPIARSA